MKTEPVVVLENVVKIYTGSAVDVPALKGISLTISEGEFVAIMGHSGSGKSTLLNLLGCLDRPTSGKIQINQTDVAVLDDNGLSHIRNKELGFVFQSFNLLARFSCLHNVETPLIYKGLDRKTRQALASEMLVKVGLKDKMFFKPTQLSGGQKQRVAIARALVTKPAILLADEPTGALDSATSHEIMQLLKELNEKEGKTVILVTHEQDIAAYAQKIISIKDGEIEKIYTN